MHHPFQWGKHRSAGSPPYICSQVQSASLTVMTLGMAGPLFPAFERRLIRATDLHHAFAGASQILTGGKQLRTHGKVSPRRGTGYLPMGAGLAMLL